MRKSYPTNLTDAEWLYLKPHLPTPKRRGRPRIHSSREILNAIFYVLKSGCQWRLLPCDFPPWETVYHYFRRWSLDGTWEKVKTRQSTSACELASDETLNPVPG
jgi:putative transposase